MISLLSLVFQKDLDLSEKLNLKEISSVLGNGVTFMSSIYLTHPQPTSDGAGAGGGGE